MPLQKYFPFLQEGIHRAFNHSERLNWQIHIRDGLELHFSHFYCCSSACPCITLRNGTVCTVKWNHILHRQKRALRIENDHIMFFQIASLKGIKVRPACVSYYTKGRQKKAKISLFWDLTTYMYACGPCFPKKQLGMEILFWRQTCCSQPLEWLKPVRRYHRSLPARALYLFGMCYTRSKTTQNKNILYS